MIEGYITIKEAAKKFGIHTETLRRWDRKGKLLARRHPMNNYRIYKLSEIAALITLVQGR